MSDEMAQGLFEDETSVQLEQVVFDYRLLSADTRVFVLEKTDETQWLLKKTAENIIKIGKNLQEVKARLPHGMFLPWLKSEFGLSEKMARNFMYVKDRFENKSVNFTDLSISALYLLSAPGTPPEAVDEALQRAEKGEKITHALAKQIIEAQDALKKAQEAEAQARADAILAQQQLFNVQEKYASESARWDVEKEALTKPDTVTVEVVKEVIPLSAVQEMKRLESQLGKQKSDYDKQEAELHAKKAYIARLEDDIRTAAINKELTDNADRIRQKWRLITNETHSSMMRLIGQLPTPIDLRSFEDEDWERVNQLKETLRRVLDECDNLHVAPVSSGPFMLRGVK